MQFSLCFVLDYEGCRAFESSSLLTLSSLRKLSLMAIYLKLPPDYSYFTLEPLKFTSEPAFQLDEMDVELQNYDRLPL